MTQGSLPGGIKLPNSYGRNGPFGELVWSLLRRLKARFVLEIIAHVQRRMSGEIPQFMKTLKLSVTGAITEMREEAFATRDHRATIMGQRWSSPPGRDFDTHALAKLRIQQLDDYFRSIHLSAEKLGSSTPGGTWEWRLAQFLATVIWPYYFLRVRGEGSRDFLVTWMPFAHFLSKEFEIQPRKREFGEGVLKTSLYPSILNALAGKDEITESIQYWCSLGDFGDEKTVIAENRDVGHVQDFHAEYREPRYIANVLEEAPERSRLSDHFYYNRSAVALPQVNADNQDVSGIIYWCTPIADLWHIFFSALENPDTENVRRATIDSKRPSWLLTVQLATHKAWGQIDGADHEKALLARYRQHEALRVQSSSALNDAFTFRSWEEASVSAHILRTHISHIRTLVHEQATEREQEIESLALQMKHYLSATRAMFRGETSVNELLPLSCVLDDIFAVPKHPELQWADGLNSEASVWRSKDFLLIAFETCMSNQRHGLSGVEIQIHQRDNYIYVRLKNTLSKEDGLALLLDLPKLNLGTSDQLGIHTLHLACNAWFKTRPLFEIIPETDNCSFVVTFPIAKS